jgi:hypothetical protein
MVMTTLASHRIVHVAMYSINHGYLGNLDSWVISCWSRIKAGRYCFHDFCSSELSQCSSECTHYTVWHAQTVKSGAIRRLNDYEEIK